MKRIVSCKVHILALVLTFTTVAAFGQSVPSPEEFYGFKMGADGELARWDKIVE